MIGDNGFENMVWFMGLVEDNDDPLAGRIKVRCFGFHPPFSDGLVATEDLPWAHVIRDSKFTSVPDNGDLVIGFFMDGRDAQHPVIMGVLNSAKYSLPTAKVAYGPPPGNAGTSTGGKPVRTGNAVNTELEPHQRAFLDAISAKESGGAYNIRYDGGAGSTFDMSSGQHPNVRVALPGGNFSTAAGRYQFTYSTWQEVSGGAPFTPKNQDLYAWKLAEARYPGDLNEYLKTNGVDSNVLNSLSPTWAAFGNSSSHGDIIATYNNSLGAEPGDAAATAAFENQYMAPTQDSVNNFGNGAIPWQMSGEGVEQSPVLVAATARKSVQFGNYNIDEPGIPVSASTKSSVWATRFHGSYVELSGKSADEEFINIVHSSGSRITMDNNGNVTIKAFGKLHTSSEGEIEETAEGSRLSNYNQGYVLNVAGGRMEVFSRGNIEFNSGNDIIFNAGRKFVVSSGDSIEMSGSKFAATAKVDAIDLAAAGKVAISSSAKGLSIQSVGPIYVQGDASINMKAETISTASSGEFGIKAGGSLKVKGTPIHLNTPGAEPADVPDSLAAVAANTPTPTSLGVDTPNSPNARPSAISPSMVDESGPR